MAETYSPAAFFAAERRMEGGVVMTMEQIAALLQSADYKERFRGEYWLVKTKRDGLAAILERLDAGTLDFTPDCPRYLLELQLGVMEDYVGVLETRAVIEGVTL